MAKVEPWHHLIAEPAPSDHVVQLYQDRLEPTQPLNPGGLLGRANELAMLNEFLSRATERGGALVIRGDVGVGKTALLDCAATMARTSGWRVLHAAAVEPEAEMSFAALSQLLLPLEPELGRLSEPHRDALRAALGLRTGTSSEGLVVCNATLSLLRLAALGRPVVVLVDDLPWLDHSSAVVLGFVARRLVGTRVGFLATMRTGEGGFFETTELPTLEVGPLDDEPAAQLLDSRFPALDAGARQRVLDESRGNPLALLELPGTVSFRAGRSGAGPVAVMPTSGRLHGVFASRIWQLHERARRLLLLAALDGTGDLRALASEGPVLDVLADLAEAERRRLVYFDAASHRLGFRHPLVPSTVIELATEQDRRAAHQDLAGFYTEDPDRRTWHLSEAASSPDEEVASLLEGAGRRTLRRGDPVGATTLFIRSSELSCSKAERSRRLAEAAYVGANVSGHMSHASRLLADLGGLGLGTPASLPAMVTAANLILNEDGDIDAAYRLLLGAIKGCVSCPDSDCGTIDEALYTLVLACFFAGRSELWGAFLSALPSLGRDLPATVSLGSQTLSDPARTASAVLGKLRSEIGRLTEETDQTWIVRIALAGSLLDLLPACRSALRRVARGEGGAIAAAVNAQSLLASDAFSTGEWEEARQLAAAAANWCLENRYVLRTWPGRHVIAMIAAARGDYATAATMCAEMVQWAVPRRAGLVQCYAWQTLALSALGRGDFEEAYRQASKISPAGALAPSAPYALLVHLDLVEAAVRTGRQAEAAAQVAACRRGGIAGLSPRLALLVGAAEGLVAPDQAALGHFGEALAVPEAASWPFDFARVQLLYGERLRRARYLREARRQLEAALETFERLGARPWVQRTANELRAAGQAKPHANVEQWDALTPQEREVAQLAAMGLSNKQIAERLYLSHRTVGFHLYRVFPKLGVTSRAALRDALASREPGGERRTAQV